MRTNKLPAGNQWPPTDTTSIIKYAKNTPSNKKKRGHRSAHDIEPCPKFIAHLNLAAKRQCIKTAHCNHQQSYRHYITVKSAIPRYPANKAAIGLVISPFSTNARKNRNDWHACAVLRRGIAIWVFDPRFDNNRGKRRKKRKIAKLSELDGLENIRELIGKLGKIERIQIRGIGDTKLECMGRCAQWMDGVLQDWNADDSSSSTYDELTPTRGCTTVLL